MNNVVHSSLSTSGKWFVLALAVVVLSYPWIFGSNYAVELGMFVLLSAYLGQCWNISGGFAGQFSFGHVAFFGVGAYCSAILVASHGVNPWLAFGMAILCGALLGTLIGALSFRFGLKGSYFALITLAFAEVLRVLSDSLPFTRGGLGILIPVSPGVSQFQFSTPIGYYYLAAVLCTLSLGIAFWLKNCRFGARLAAIRENEDAAKALGIDVFREKVRCLALSGAMTAAGGSFYMQKYLYIDPRIAFDINRSVEMLLISIIGGAGTVFGPLIGAVALGSIGELTRLMSSAPGLSLVVYGVILVIIVAFLPNGLIGVLKRRSRKGGEHAA